MAFYGEGGFMVGVFEVKRGRGGVVGIPFLGVIPTFLSHNHRPYQEGGRVLSFFPENTKLDVLSIYGGGRRG